MNLKNNNKFTYTPLKEISKQVKRDVTIDLEKSYRTVGCRLYGKGVYQRETKIGSEILAKKMFLINEGDFVINKIWAQKGSAGVVTANVAGSVVTQDFPVFELNSREVLPQYIGLYVQTPFFWAECKKHSHGTSGRQRLNPKEIPNIKFPLVDIDYQKKIVKYVSGIHERIEKAIELRQKTLSTSRKLFELIIEETYKKLRSKETSRLSGLTSKVGSGSTPRGGRSTYVPSGIPFIRSMNVRMRKFSTDGLVYIRKEIHENMKNTKVFQNDVLLNITGASIGRVSCVPQNMIEANVNQHVSILRPTEFLKSRYLMYWLSNLSSQQKIYDLQKGATRPALTKKQIQDLEILVPSLHVQKQIVRYLDELQLKFDSYLDFQERNVEDLQLMKNSILNSIFLSD